MKYAILISGIIAAVLFLISLYAFLYAWNLFKPVAYAFLSITIIFFILNIIVKSKEERESRRRTGRF
jgi:CHASE2 domain-containing sensor protein